MFAVGDKVRLKIDSSKIGIVGTVLPEVDGIGHYLVFHDASNTCEYYEDQLEKVVEDSSFVGSNPKAFFNRYLTMKFGLEDSAAVFSLNSGNITFIPYQFRPLKKIIKAERPRMLIADEVGVGKTIEAGLILKEYEHRENVESVVIVCPKELCTKWQREMKSRFDETFAIMDSGAFSYCVGECEMEGVWPSRYAKCIIGLEMIRQTRNIESMAGLEDQIHFDMLIVDEAHHVVNDSSNSYAAIAQLTENSDVVVFLSATPIQLKSRDLYVLLNLLLPEEFNEERTFSLMAAPNAMLNAAIRSIRNSMVAGWQDRAFENLLDAVSVNEWAESRFRGNRQLGYWTSRLSSHETLDDDERIACLRDLEDLNSFSHVINRTKRRDIGEFTLREPITVEISYSEREFEFYKAARDFGMIIYAAQHGTPAAKMIMATVERLMTSCLPAFVRVLDRFIEKGFVALSDLTDDLEYESASLDAAGDLKEAALALREMACDLPTVDQKTAQLLSIIEEIKGDESSGKLLVFSFFKHTLNYLLERIAGKARAALVTGDTPSQERDSIRERFRLPAEDKMAIDVLLSSEVGCEGLDYEFCSRMVNYDIPWNPMKIEQRIGRIDRFGQKAPKVRIYNFITSETVEARIFFRCFERLGVFNSTIGDLESVLGSVQSQLTAAAFDLNLDEDQKIIKAQQSIDNAIRDRNEQAEFEVNSKDLFLTDLEEDAELIGRERVVQMGLLSRFVSDFLSDTYLSAQCTPNDNGTIALRMGADDRKRLHKELVLLKRSRAVDVNSKQYKNLDAYLLGDKSSVEIRFDGESEGSSESLFVTLGHPLMQLALEASASVPVNPCIALSVESGGILAPGAYRFACYRWDERGYRDSSAIAIVMRNERTGEHIDVDVVEFESLLLSARAEMASTDCGEPALDEAVRRRQAEARRRLVEVNEDVVTRKLSTLDESYQRKISRALEAQSKTDEPRIRTMREHQIRNLEAAWEANRSKLLEKRQADVLVSRFAHGFIEVV